jgi:hypothetical protein
MEEMYIKAIKGGILKLKNGGLTTDVQAATKVKVAKALNGLKGVNEPMYDEYLEKYKKTLAGLK